MKMTNLAILSTILMIILVPFLFIILNIFSKKEDRTNLIIQSIYNIIAVLFI